VSPALRILVVRRDNIGDLVCTTPLLRALRARHPGAWIGLLGNSYNVPVLEGHPDLDEVLAYTKLKHRGGSGLLGNLVDRARLLSGLRREPLEWLLLPGAPRAQGMVRALRATRVVCADGVRPGEHEVERVFRLGRELGVEGEPPACSVAFDEARTAALRASLGITAGMRVIGLHISARKPSQRWPIARHVELVDVLLAASPDVRVLLFWSPGSAADALHPGDDEAARQLLAVASGPARLLPVPTVTLPDLVAGLSLCDALVCSDGGAMHIGAALGKPIVCLFGQSDASRWRPWGVAHRLLQPESRNVVDVSVDAVRAALDDLREQPANV
jgi:heptosyltransferase-3